MPRAGLVPEPLLPAYWPQGNAWKHDKAKGEILFKKNLRTMLYQSENDGETH